MAPFVVIPELGRVRVDDSSFEEMAATVIWTPGERDAPHDDGVMPFEARLVAERIMEPEVSVEQVEDLSPESAVELLEAILGVELGS